MVPELFLSLGTGYIYSSIYGAFFGVIVAFFVHYFGATFRAVTFAMMNILVGFRLKKLRDTKLKWRHQMEQEISF